MLRLISRKAEQLDRAEPSSHELRPPCHSMASPLCPDVPQILHTGWCKSCATQSHSDTRGEIPPTSSENRIESGLDTQNLQRRAKGIHEDVLPLCEEARLFWSSKRNPKQALDMFLNGTNTPRGQRPKSSKADLLEYLVRLGYDVNALDHAGRTVLYWSRLRTWTEESVKLETLGGLMFVSLEHSFDRVRRSIIEMLEKLKDSQDAFKAASVDLTRKWDWDNLGRYLLFAGDRENACRTFEAGATFDLTVPGDIPAVHYFMCDKCHTEYTMENLLRGKRCIPEGLTNVDLCASCAEFFGPAKLDIPGQDCLDSKSRQHEAKLSAFARIEKDKN